MLIGGFALAWFGYIRDQKAPAGWAKQNPLIYRFLSHKWYFDELYDMIFVQVPPSWSAACSGAVRRHGHHRSGSGRTGCRPPSIDVTRQAVKLQTGYVYHYAFVMLIGVGALITWYVVGGMR